jgi:hypothetical protein
MVYDRREGKKVSFGATSILRSRNPEGWNVGHRRIEKSRRFGAKSLKHNNNKDPKDPKDKIRALSEPWHARWIAEP